MTTTKQASQSIEEQSALLARHLLRALGQGSNKPGLELTAKVYKAYLKGASCVDTTASELSTLPTGLVLEAGSSSHKPLGATPLVHYQGKVYLHKTNALEHQLAEHLIWAKNRPVVLAEAWESTKNRSMQQGTALKRNSNLAPPRPTQPSISAGTACFFSRADREPARPPLPPSWSDSP